MSDTRTRAAELQEERAELRKKFLDQPGPKSLKAYDPYLHRALAGKMNGIHLAVKYVLGLFSEAEEYELAEIRTIYKKAAYEEAYNIHSDKVFGKFTLEKDKPLTELSEILPVGTPGLVAAFKSVEPNVLAQSRQEQEDFQADVHKPEPGAQRGGALRFNKGKTRYELISNIGIDELAKVYTLGAHKYSEYKDENGEITLGMNIPFKDVGKYQLVKDAARNWRSGQNWLGAMASIKRHIAAWESGEDLDPELGTYHLANAAWGMFTLLDFYKSFPQGDDRPHTYLSPFKIGLDIDEVLADWVGAWMELHDLDERPINWAFHRNIIDEFDKMKEAGTLNDFYLSIKPKIDPSEIPFEPHCYITHRPIPTEITEQWLTAHGFPTRPVFTVTPEKSKVDYALEQGLDIFVDDGWNNFVSMNRAGICTYLMDAPHNQRYKVGHKRIKELKDLI